MGKGRLEVTEEILERVVYGMENQKDRLFLDLSDGNLRLEQEIDGTSIPIPPWGPTEGYRLMDGFAGTLPDTVFKERLLDILHSGTGVFRHFKDALKQRPELEGLWRCHKKREMRKTALSWLSRWSEALALEDLGPEPEDWEDLALADFAVREAKSGDWESIRDWDQVAVTEDYPEISPDERCSAMASERRDAELEDGDVIVAESPSGEIVGFSWIIIEGESGRLNGRLIQVYVRPEFRGLGIGRMLAGKSLERASDKGATILSVRTGASGKLLNPYFERIGFAPVMTWWRKSSQHGVP